MQSTEPGIRRPIPMSVHPINTDHTAAPPPKTQYCAQCKKKLSLSAAFKNCDACREKFRMYSARSLEKKRNARTQLNLLTTGTKRPMENVDGIDVGGRPKKAKGDVASSLSKDGFTVKPVKMQALTEYQTPANFYQSLSVQSRPLQFYGSYAIVSTSKDPITPSGRVKLVSQDLREGLKKIGCGFDRDTPLNGYATAQTSSLMFRCTCGPCPNDTLNTNPPSDPTSRLDQHLLPKSKFVPRNGASEDVPRHLSEPVSQRRQFLAGLSYLMITKRTPLPSTLTGVPILTYDPHTSPWRFLTISTRGTGIIRLGGQDVDLYKLWISVFQAGGHEKLSRESAWSQILPAFNLPPQYEPSLLILYQKLLGMFEDVYRKGTLKTKEPNRAITAHNIVPSDSASLGALSSDIPLLPKDPTWISDSILLKETSSFLREPSKLESGACGGSVLVKVEDDFTHPLVKGHRITVRIKHDKIK